ncbi:MAG TPA: glycosyltransferase family 39 protein [Flavobacterium sp.]|nr:glycosyltransferase family 39 protein [Flavobacterium sp.]
MKGSNNRIYFAIVIISAILAIVVLNLPFKAKPLGDDTFHNEAKSLALFLKGHLPAEKVVITRAPGPVLFYTPAYMLAPSDASDNTFWTYGVIFSSFMMLLSMLLIFKTAASFFSKEVGILSVFLFFIFPIHCYYSLGINAEAPAFFSIAIALYGWSKAWFSPQKKTGWICLIVGFLFLILNRPNTMFLFPIVFLLLVYAWFKRKEFFAVYAKPLMISFAVVALLGAGTLQIAKCITARNGYVEQNNLLYYVIYEGRFQFRDEPFDFRFWDGDNRPDSKDYQNWKKTYAALDAKIIQTHGTYEAVYKDFIINDIKAHPLIFVRQFFVKCFYGNIYIINSIRPENFKIGPLKGHFGYTVFMLAINIINILILFGVGLFLFKEKNQLAYWPFWGIVVALFVFHGLTYMEPRYMFPSKVALHILGAAGLYQLTWVKRAVNKISTLFFPVKSF